MARRAAEQTPEEVERKRLHQRACQARYYQRHTQEIDKKRKERYTPEARRREYLRHREAEKARANARRAKLRAEAAQAEPPEERNQETKIRHRAPIHKFRGELCLI